MMANFIAKIVNNFQPFDYVLNTPLNIPHKAHLNYILSILMLKPLDRFIFVVLEIIEETCIGIVCFS